MSNLAILIGNTDYCALNRLDCCRDDVLAMKELLLATGKYPQVEVIENAEADDLKTRIRNAIDKVQSPEELFFYYTGHGCQFEEEFFYCATNFDTKRPNETGISTSDLHTLLRLAGADLVVKVVDACNSGSLLVKSDLITPQLKQGFNNLIQISSCLDSQNSLTGNPLSLFTEKFRSAVLRKTDGVVYYTDVIGNLRDAFIDNNSQTPFFVSQVTGREKFVDDARLFDELRSKLDKVQDIDSNATYEEASAPPLTAQQVLAAYESSIVKPDIMETFVAGFFDDIQLKLSKEKLTEYFDVEFTIHNDFREDTSRAFIIRILSKEKRIDDFVTANISRKKRRRNPLSISLMSFASQWADDDEIIETYDLSLNCQMSRAQLCVTLTPKYGALQRVKLVITCAPSLEACYVFEVATRHKKTDFDAFDRAGQELVQRWYKFKWTDDPGFASTKISCGIAEIVNTQVENAIKRISGDD